MRSTYTAIYTETPPVPGRDTKTGDLFVIFAHRDEKTADDIAGTKAALEADGFGVYLQETHDLREIGDLLLLETDASNTFDSREGAGKTYSPDEAILSPDTIAAIHQCLKQLAGHCDGARTLDGAGFNKLDAEFGRSLAESRFLSQKQAIHGQKLVRKYHRQLPEDLVLVATANPPLLCAPAAPREALTPAEAINRRYQNRSGAEVASNGSLEPYGDTYQNGVRPGFQKLSQFREIMAVMGVPELYANEKNGPDAETMVYVKLFDPSGNWTWYITEFSPVAPDGVPDLAFGLVDGHEVELGYIDLAELSSVQGSLGIGIEVDMHFTPRLLSTVRETLAGKTN